MLSGFAIAFEKTRKINHLFMSYFIMSYFIFVTILKGYFACDVIYKFDITDIIVDYRCIRIREKEHLQ